jgi:hypothetical protein
MASARAASPVGVAFCDSGTQCDTIVLREESTPFWDMCKTLNVPEEVTRALIVAEGRSLSDAQATEELMTRLGDAFIAGNFQRGINRYGQAVDWKKLAESRYKTYRRFRDRLSQANTLSYQRKRRCEELESLIETHDVIDKTARALEVIQLREARRAAGYAERKYDRMKRRFSDTWFKGICPPLQSLVRVVFVVFSPWCTLLCVKYECLLLDDHALQYTYLHSRYTFTLIFALSFAGVILEDKIVNFITNSSFVLKEEIAEVATKYRSSKNRAISIMNLFLASAHNYNAKTAKDYKVYDNDEPIGLATLYWAIDGYEDRTIYIQQLETDLDVCNTYIDQCEASIETAKKSSKLMQRENSRQTFILLETEAKFRQQSRRMKAMTITLRHRNDKIAALKRTIVAKQNQIQAQTQQSIKLSTRVLSLKLNVKVKQHEVNVATGKIAALTAEIQALSNEHAESVEAVNTLQQQKTALEKVNSDLVAQMQQLQVQHNAAIQALQQELVLAQAHVADHDTLVEQLATPNRNNLSLSQQLATANGNITTLSQQLASANGTDTTLSQELATANGNNTALTQQLATVNGGLAALQHELAVAQAKVVDNDTLVAQLATVNGDNTALTQQLATVNGQLLALQQQSAQQGQEKDTVIAKLHAELQGKVVEYDTMVTQLASVNGNFALVSQQLATANEEIVTLQQQAIQQAEQFEADKVNLAQSKDTIVAELKAELAAAEDKYDKYVATSARQISTIQAQLKQQASIVQTLKQTKTALEATVQQQSRALAIASRANTVSTLANTIDDDDTPIIKGAGAIEAETVIAAASKQELCGTGGVTSDVTTFGTTDVINNGDITGLANGTSATVPSLVQRRRQQIILSSTSISPLRKNLSIITSSAATSSLLPSEFNSNSSNMSDKTASLSPLRSNCFLRSNSSMFSLDTSSSTIGTIGTGIGMASAIGDRSSTSSRLSLQENTMIPSNNTMPSPRSNANANNSSVNMKPFSPSNNNSSNNTGNNAIMKDSSLVTTSPSPTSRGRTHVRRASTITTTGGGGGTTVVNGNSSRSRSIASPRGVNGNTPTAHGGDDSSTTVTNTTTTSC